MARGKVKKYSAMERKAYWAGYGLGVVHSMEGGAISSLTTLKNRMGDPKFAASAQAGYFKAREDSAYKHMVNFGVKFD